jgi:hypothetical protein
MVTVKPTGSDLCEDLCVDGRTLLGTDIKERVLIRGIRFIRLSICVTGKFS